LSAILFLFYNPDPPNTHKQETLTKSHTNFLYIVCSYQTIHPEWEDRLYGFLGGLVRQRRGRLIEIGGIEDHLHLLARLGPTVAFSDFMRDLKSESTGFVRRRRPVVSATSTSSFS
jgi:REP element-mobilizing transposase RayT